MDTSIIVALIGLCGTVLVTLVQNIISNKQIKKQIQDIAEHTKENFLGLQRLTIMAEEMPIAERIIAGKKYIDAGGNGEVKSFYYNLIKEHTK